MQLTRKQCLGKTLFLGSQKSENSVTFNIRLIHTCCKEEKKSLPSKAWPVYFQSKMWCLQQDYLDLDPNTENTKAASAKYHK